MTELRTLSGARIERAKRWLAIAGAFLAFCLLAFMLILWPQLLRQGRSLINQSLDLVITTRNAMTLIGESLDSAQIGFETLDKSLKSLHEALAELPALTDGLTQVIDKDLGRFARDGQHAMLSAAKSSRLIDDALKLLANIPLIGVDYRPEQPLEASFKQLATTFGEMPAALTAIRNDLQQSNASVQVLNQDLERLTKELSVIGNELNEFRPVMTEYFEYFSRLADALRGLQKQGPILINAFFLITVLLSLWLFLSLVIRAYELNHGLSSGRIGNSEIRDADIRTTKHQL